MLGLCKSDTNCTLKLCYHVLQKATTAPNVICLSRLHHQLFDKFHISWKFDYNTNPTGHPGTCVVAHVKYIDRLYFSTHGNPG